MSAYFTRVKPSFQDFYECMSRSRQIRVHDHAPESSSNHEAISSYDAVMHRFFRETTVVWTFLNRLNNSPRETRSPGNSYGLLIKETSKDWEHVCSFSDRILNGDSVELDDVVAAADMACRVHAALHVALQEARRGFILPALVQDKVLELTSYLRSVWFTDSYMRRPALEELDNIFDDTLPSRPSTSSESTDETGTSSEAYSFNGSVLEYSWTLGDERDFTSTYRSDSYNSGYVSNETNQTHTNDSTTEQAAGTSNGNMHVILEHSRIQYYLVQNQMYHVYHQIFPECQHTSYGHRDGTKQTERMTCPAFGSVRRPNGRRVLSSIKQMLFKHSSNLLNEHDIRICQTLSETEAQYWRPNWQIWKKFAARRSSFGVVGGLFQMDVNARLCQLGWGLYVLNCIHEKHVNAEEEATRDRYSKNELVMAKEINPRKD